MELTHEKLLIQMVRELAELDLRMTRLESALTKSALLKSNDLRVSTREIERTRRDFIRRFGLSKD